jgi:hypothetical protein
MSGPPKETSPLPGLASITDTAEGTARSNSNSTGAKSKIQVPVDELMKRPSSEWTDDELQIVKAGQPQRQRHGSAPIIPAIKTLYRGRTYRSRLEARWAAFFDLVDWRYEYEPFDLNGWIPDFVLFGKEYVGNDLLSSEVLVEVKPYSRLEQFDTEKILTAMQGTHASGSEVLLLGYTIQAEEWYSGSYDGELGWLGDVCPCSDDGALHYNFAVARFTECGGALGFYHSDDSWHNRITGIGDGDADLGSHLDLHALWSQAGDAVMWRGGRV